MTEPKGWRVVVIAAVLPDAAPVIEYVRELGHDVVAWLMARQPQDRDRPLPPWGETTDRSAPQGVNLIMARDKADLAPILRGLEPDVVLCSGFSWKIPQEALDVPRYGCVNHHSAPLPRYRGPIPLSWALREGDTEFFLTWHRMDAELDTGPILAQSSIPILDEETTIFETAPRLIQAKRELLPRVFERLAAGDPGERASWAGYFEEDTRRAGLGRHGRSTTRSGHGTPHGPGPGARGSASAQRRPPGDPGRRRADGRSVLAERRSPR